MKYIEYIFLKLLSNANGIEWIYLIYGIDNKCNKLYHSNNNKVDITTTG